MLHLEEYRLVQWGEKSGLLRSQAEMVAGVLHERLNRRLIEETLSELATLLTDADAMKQKYKLEIATEINGPKMSPEDLPEYVARGGGAGVLGGAVSVSKRRNILNVAGLFKDMPRKMWWVVADKADFEVLVRQIGFFVQRLVDLLDHQQQEVMQNDIRLLLLNVVALNDKMDELQAIQRGVEVVVGQDNPMASSAAVKHLRMQLLDDHRDQTNGHRQLPPPYNSTYNTNYQRPQSQGHTGTGGAAPGSDQLMPPAPLAYNSGSYPTSPNSSRRSSSSGAININGGGSSLRYEYNSSGGTSPRPKSPGLLNYRRRHPLPAIDPNLISNKSGEVPRPKREVALYNTHQSSSDIPTGTAELIYIEWKAINKPLRSKIRPRVENLAHLLHAPKHPSFRTLHCRGFYEDYEKGQYGFVFDRPAGAEPNRPPVSLLQMFRLKNFLPSQTQRIRLATILASALSQLHSAGWLHKSLRADNILFFPSKTAVGVPGAHKSGILLDEPYLVGYEYARFDGTSEVSEQPSSNPEHDIYRHPLAIGDYSESFNRLFDIYSLGLIFLEIALWRPLRKIVCKVIPELGSSGTSGAGSGSRSKLKKAMAGALSSPPTPHVPLTQIMKIQEWLLDPTTEDNMPGTLDFFMGQIYKDVVIRCLRGDFVDAQDEEGNQTQLDNMDEGYSDLPELEGARVTEGFFIKVVRELERCVV